jgi:hypothetical protein
MSLKFLTGPDGTGSSADLLKALGYAKSMRDLWVSSGGAKGANIRVLNNSYGGLGFSQAELDAIGGLGHSGILFVVAAGNDSSDNDLFPVYPANYQSPNVISVAASNQSGIRAIFSNSGPGTVHITAPGEHILSTTPRNTYEFFSGTSMSTSYVSGAAALVCAAFPSISLQTLRAKLLYSGFVANWQYSNNYPIQTGRSVDANAALQSVTTSDNSPPAAVGQFRITDSFDFPTVHLQWQAPGDDGNVGRVAAYEVRYSDDDLSDPTKFEVARPLAGPIPAEPGTFASDEVKALWRHPTGFIGVRAVDDAGNAGPISAVPLSKTSAVADPYLITEGPATPLSTGGTPLGLVADESFKTYNLPFPVKFFSGPWSTVTISSNGTIYMGFLPFSSFEPAASVNTLTGYRMIAAAWDDLRTDRRAGDDVYVVQPDANRIIFRWQAVTYDTPIGPGQTRGENPVNFEVELKSDGTIILRYGDGNQKMWPVVGLGGGWPEPYVITSHTSEEALKDLTNAGTITFTRRDSVPSPTPTPTPTPTPPPAGTDQIVISQIYTTVGSGTPSYQSGYVELFNRGTNTVNLNSWLFQFGSETGVIGSAVSFNRPNGVFIQPGQYVLLQVGLTGGGTPLPTPDISTGQVNTQISGKILVSRPGVPFLGGNSCPLPNAGISDLLGYGQNANCFEGSGSAPLLSNTTALIRKGGGCTDTDNNAGDFVVGPPNPHNSSSSINPCGNPIDVPSLFVKQQYLDFLNRQPDQSGWDFWTQQITSCGSDAQCIQVKRINTSGAFFLSIEFQQTGNLVYKMYKAAFGNLAGKPVAVDRAPFLTDTRQIQSTPKQVVVGQANWETQLETNKQAFALAFVQRAAFQTAHGSQNAAAYVSSLFQNAGVTPSSAETTAAVNAFNNELALDTGRAAALRSVCESNSVSTKLNNEAFVLMQYFGYLQRNPYDPPELKLDYAGFNFWLGKLNQFNGDFIAAEMVKAFISSAEYRQRFGP